jgi:hypothetical protein
MEESDDDAATLGASMGVSSGDGNCCGEFVFQPEERKQRGPGVMLREVFHRLLSRSGVTILR